MSQADAVKCSASQPRVTPTLRLLKSQEDQVDSPPSAGLTVNQYESRLIAVNLQIEPHERQQGPNRSGNLWNVAEFLL